MRYQVRFDDCVNSWIVIDTRVGGMVIQKYETNRDARYGAWEEEERWYKCSREGSSETLLGAI